MRCNGCEKGMLYIDRKLSGNLYVIKCDNPNHVRTFYARLRYYPYWEAVAMKEVHPEDKKRTTARDPFHGYNVGLGEYVDGKDDYKRKMKAKGLKEV